MHDRVCQKLAMHPASCCDAVQSIAVTVTRAAEGGLRIHYRVAGDIARLRLPQATMPVRADGLWQHSCFEAFLRTDDKDRYLEFNFAPSGAWACYRFDGRRTGRSCPELPAPRITAHAAGDTYELTVDLAPAALDGTVGTAANRAGFAAVIEDERGTLSYWALAHRGAAPDFHDPATFLFALPAA